MREITVAELIELLKQMPQDAEVYYMSGPLQDQIYADEWPPRPCVQDDGRVQL